MIKLILKVLLTIAIVGLMVHICINLPPTVNENTHVFNVDMRIVSINGEQSISDDKFRTPQYINVILFETIKEPKLYREIQYISDYNQYQYIDYTDIHINTEWLYNHQPGDTVHFDYLLKDRFFKINKK